MWKVYQGNVLEVLRQLPDEFVQTVVTSPPYYGLRAYRTNPQIWDGDPNCNHEWGGELSERKRGSICGTNAKVGNTLSGVSGTEIKQGCFCIKCGAWRGELGLEPTPELYVNHLVEIFREVRRVLRKDGTLWLNIGDSYAGSGGPGSQYDNKATGKYKEGFQKYKNPNRSVINLKPKDLIGIPWRVAFALQADGWYLRSAIPWIKGNPMPESTKDRPGVAHEYFFLLSKSKKYYYDVGAIKKERTTHENRLDAVVRDREKGYNSKLSKIRNCKQNELGKRTYTGFNDRWEKNPTAGRNRRTSDWFKESLDILIDETLEYLQYLLDIRDNGGMLLSEEGEPLALLVNTQPYKGAHFATFNPKLITPCILAGASPKSCPKCGAPWERIVEHKRPEDAKPKKVTESWNSGTGLTPHSGYRGTPIVIDYGFHPTCSCPDNDGSGKCIVLDPFAGSGTTLQVAEELGRDSIGIELNPDYCKLIEERMANLPKTRQVSLF